MKQLLLFLSRAFAWLKPLVAYKYQTSDSIPLIRTRSRDFVGASNDLFDQARRRAMNRPNVLKTRRQRLLARLIARELERHHDSLLKKEQTNLSGTGAELSGFYLRSGYLYFSDFGISSDSEFYFLELGRIKPLLYRELKAVPKFLSHMMFEGDDRKEEFQRKLYDTLFDKHLWNPTFGSLSAL